LQVRDQFVQAHARLARDLKNPQRGEDAVARGGVLAEDHVAGLLPAQRRAQPHHSSSTYLSPPASAPADARALQRLLQAEIGHDRGNHGIARQFARGLHRARGGEQHAIAIHHLAARGDEDRASASAVEGNAKVGALREHMLAQRLQVQGATVQV